MKQLAPLFSRTSTGAIQEWQIEIDQDKYRTVYGQTDGKKITTEWTVAVGTNIGRANERTGEKQAIAEAKSIWKKKRDSGCWEDINDIDKVSFIEPMLAQNYEDRKDELVYPLYCQPKLDGNRCIVTKDGMQSRNGKPIVSCPHILKKLAKVFEAYPDLQLDGELYADKFANDFNRLSSIIRKSKPTENDLMESDALMQYWIYDIVDTKSVFSERNLTLNLLFKRFNLWKDPSLVLVETKLVNSEPEMTKLYEDWIEAGFEGQMVRTNQPYEQKRSSGLLKRKEFQDREYRVISVHEGEGNKTGMAGYMILQNDLADNTFRSNIKGNHTFLKEVLTKKDELVGRLVTVKFFNLTPDKKVPRFPYIIKIREDYDV